MLSLRIRTPEIYATPGLQLACDMSHGYFMGFDVPLNETAPPAEGARSPADHMMPT